MKKTQLFLIILGLVLLTGCTVDEGFDDIEEADSITNESVDVETLSVLESDYGSIGALESDAFTIEEMLIYALEDEFAARNEYDYILTTFDVTNPFSNIILSEETHIDLLLPMFDIYDIEVPADGSSEHLIELDSLQETFETGVLAEELNIAMYNLFLEQDDLPADLVDVFTKLRDASINHLEAFQRNADRY
jgi:hypothetical protein